MRSRRSPRPPSWLSVVESAAAGFTGTARLVRDEPVPATQTAFRGAGHALVAEIEPEHAVFGTRPEAAVVLEGETNRPPEQRPDPRGLRFPPDSLREVSYWDQAPPGIAEPVLCVLSDPPAVRVLLGPDDDLPQAVRMIRGWTESTGGQGVDVERSLSGAEGAPAICYVAGFELRLRTTTDLPGLVERFLWLPGRPGSSARGILSLLQLRTVQLPEAGVVALARRLLDAMADERDPEALVSYLTWFDAQRERISKADAGMESALQAEAERVATLRFDGPDGEAWRQEVASFAGALTDGA